MFDVFNQSRLTLYNIVKSVDTLINIRNENSSGLVDSVVTNITLIYYYIVLYIYVEG